MIKPAAGHPPLAYSSPEAVQTTGTVAIQALKIDALTHPDEWTRKLHARIILLTIYEWDADKVTGRGLKDALDTIQGSPALTVQAVDALRALRRVQRKVTKEYGFVRNAAIAHRDPNTRWFNTALFSI
jgi:hypothetical protein